MTPESEIAPEVRKTGRSWVDLSAVVCALTISVTSLWVAVRHGHTMERMADANARLVSANSYPLLQQFQSSAADLQSPDFTRGTRVASLNIGNSGVGPAKVETLEVFWNDRPVRTAREFAAGLLRYTGRYEPVVTPRLAGNQRRARHDAARGRDKPAAGDLPRGGNRRPRCALRCRLS